MSVERIDIQVNETVRKIEVDVIKERGLQGPPGTIDLLVTDSSLYKEGNELRANVSLYTQKWIHTGSNTFPFDFEPTNILNVFIKRAQQALFADYTFTAPQTLIIQDDLQSGDEILANYEHFLNPPL